MDGVNYVISKGSDCTSGYTFPRAASVNVNWTKPVVFNQLDGSLCTAACGVTAPVVITLSSQNRTANIIINNEGRIDW